LVVDQFNVDVLPLTTWVGLALSVKVGAGDVAATVTTAEPLAEPPAPVHISVKVFVDAVSAPVLADPEVARLPVHAPLATQLVAFVEDHVSVALAPLATEVGLAVIDTVGAGTDVVTDTVTD